MINLYFWIMIRKQIEMIRFSQGLTKSELCDAAGISRSTYSLFIKGGDVSLRTLDKLFEVLGVEVLLKEGSL